MRYIVAGAYAPLGKVCARGVRASVRICIRVCLFACARARAREREGACACGVSCCVRAQCMLSAACCSGAQCALPIPSAALRRSWRRPRPCTVAAAA
jgi:hypothetical protein